MTKKRRNQEKRITNRRARHDYAVGDEFVMGIVLSGTETKALRRGHGQLRGAYVNVKDSAKGGELWLTNANVTGDSSIKISEQDQTRSRKLLAKRKEIDQLIAAKRQGMTLIPLEILTKGRYIKVKVAIARGKKKYDKRQTLKKRDEERQIQRLSR